MLAKGDVELKISLYVSLIVLFIVTGCGNESEAKFKPDTFSEKDLCIVKIDDESEKVCYGDLRSDVEKILKNGKTILPFVHYDFGVSVAYREDMVASIGLREESMSVYQTARGIRIGASKDEIKKQYGEKHAFEASKNNLDYFYNSETKSFLADESSLDAPQSQDEMAKTYMFSAMFENGSSRSIMLLDRKMAHYSK